MRDPVASENPDSDLNYWSAVAGQMASPNATNPHHSRDVADLNHALERRLVESVIRRHFPDSRRIQTLDVGAGMGRFAEVAAGFGRVHALEPSDLATTLSARFPGRADVMVVRERFERFTPRDLYDMVIFSGVFTELADHEVREFIRKGGSCLRPGGLLLVRDYLSPSTKKTHGDARYRHYARPLAFWRDLLASHGLELYFWRYSHNPYLLFQVSEKVRLLRPIRRWLYSPRLYRVHVGLNAALSPLWDPVLRYLNRDRIALFFARNGPTANAR